MRVIQAGVGGFGQSWIYAVRDCDGFEHAALVDPNPDALRMAAEILRLPSERLFTNVEDAVGAVEADGLIDCTPVPCHEYTTTLALRAGLHVLAEKPLAENMAVATKLVRTAQEAERILMVTQQFRYHDQPRFLRRLISEGAIGEIDHVHVEFQIQGLAVRLASEDAPPVFNGHGGTPFRHNALSARFQRGAGNGANVEPARQQRAGRFERVRLD